MEKVKITTVKGRIITLTVSSRTNKSIMGTDKYGKLTIVSLEEIKSMYPVTGVDF